MEDDIFIRLIVLINQIQGEDVIATTLTFKKHDLQTENSSCICVPYKEENP